MIKKHISIFSFAFPLLFSALVLSSCEANKPLAKDLTEFGIPVILNIPENAIITNKFKASDDPSYPKLRQVSIKDEKQFGLYISMYERPADHSISEIIKHDLLFENQYASKNKKVFKLIEQEKSGYIYEDNSGFNFYYYLLKNDRLITFSSIKSKEKATLEDIKSTYNSVKAAE